MGPRTLHAGRRSKIRLDDLQLAEHRRREDGGMRTVRDQILGTLAVPDV